MDPNSRGPWRPQDLKEVTQLVDSLESSLKKGRGSSSSSSSSVSVRKATFQLADGRNVDSWRMQDWDYKKANLPTYARGLFTMRNARGQQEIVVRGYDKFFNHGEVRKTEWENVKTNTRGSYELSVKENGCIIFIAGLENDTLLVCSKHSTGSRADVEVSHASAGEKWVDRHLQRVGKRRTDLARRLREMNATAVAELCDDDFEEHVLAYAPDAAGLYLHGINLNLPEFATYPGHLVGAFADEWGFKKTMYEVMDDISEVQKFLEHAAETGSYNGRDTEGFVIRCQARETADSRWCDWFFKYKFEEPYLMYRQWRECTKAVIGGKSPKIRKHKKITEDYLLYARRRLAADPKLGRLYNQNHGIIALRDDFLNSRGLKGADIIRQEIEDGEESSGVSTNVVLVPIATIGCGKTTLGLALCKLFGWGQFQNDNIEGKKNRPQRFAEAVCMLLALHPVVMADRNNHQRRERDQLIKDVIRLVPKTTFVALHWVHDRGDYNRIREVLRNRVLSRGDNHQTIHADSKSQDEIIGIMDGFLQRFQPISADHKPDSEFDLVIDLDPLAETVGNLETVVSKLYEEYPKLFPGDMPTAHDLEAAVAGVMNDYAPDLKHDLSGSFGAKPKDKAINRGQRDQQPQPKPPKKPKLDYFAVKLQVPRVLSILEAVFKDLPPERAKFYRQLSQTRRLQMEFHVTLMHRAMAEDFPEMWTYLVSLYEEAVRATPGVPEPELGTCKVHLERLVWDSRLLCFVARLINDDQSKREWKSVNKVAHITCGTVSKDVKPKESNDLLVRWLEVGSGQDTGIDDERIKGNVILDGSVRAILQKL